jgi:hypothetical protein
MQQEIRTTTIKERRRNNTVPTLSMQIEERCSTRQQGPENIANLPGPPGQVKSDLKIKKCYIP